MVFESIPNFDQYVIVSVVLFIVGLFSVMLYEKSSSSSTNKQEKSSSSSSSLSNMATTAPSEKEEKYSVKGKNKQQKDKTY